MYDSIMDGSLLMAMTIPLGILFILIVLEAAAEISGFFVRLVRRHRVRRFAMRAKTRYYT